MAVDGSTVVALSTAFLERINRGRKPDRSTQCSLTATGYPPRLHVCLSFPNKMKKSFFFPFWRSGRKASFRKSIFTLRLRKKTASAADTGEISSLTAHTRAITQRAAEGGAQPALTGLRSTSVTVQLQPRPWGLLYIIRFKWRLGRKQKPEENGPLYCREWWVVIGNIVVILFVSVSLSIVSEAKQSGLVLSKK